MPRKEKKSKLTEKNVSKIPTDYEYLGFPKDENDWIKYEGNCQIFSGIKRTCLFGGKYDEENDDQYVNEYDIDEDSDCHSWGDYIFEEEEITKNKLIEGLKTVGIKCDSVEIVNEDFIQGYRQCKCVCYYNKPYIQYISELFIENLSTFNPKYNSPLEFYFTKKLE